MALALGTTIKTVLYGFALAICIGFTLGVIVGETAFGERAIMPYLVAIDTMPKVAFAPLFVAWLGFDIDSKVALAPFIATFPIIVGTAAGLHAAEENARMLFKTMGASRWQTLWKMKLPTSLPHLFTGLKIASVGVMAGAITGKFLGGGNGFGELIQVAASQRGRFATRAASLPMSRRDDCGARGSIRIDPERLPCHQRLHQCRRDPP